MPLSKIYKVLHTFTYLSDTEVVVFINNVAGKIAASPLVFTALPYTPLAMTNAGAALTLALSNLASDDTEINRLSVEKARGIVDGILSDMASYVDTIAKGDKGIILLAGFAASRPSSTSVGPPLKQTGATFLNNGHVEQLGYKNDAGDNVVSNVLFSSTNLANFNITVMSNEEIKLTHIASGNIIYVNLFTGHTTDVYCPETGKLSGKGYAVNASGLSPGSDVAPTTIP